MQPIAITPGEPAGIGPDIVLQVAQDWRGTPLVILADPELLQQRANQLGLRNDWPLYNEIQHAPVSVLPLRCATISEPGKPNPDNAAYLLETLVQAAIGCLNNAFSAVVTGPVNKAVINAAGLDFAGHTDFFAALTQTPCTVMTFLTDFCPVGLMTTHIPLRKVADTITTERVIATATTLIQGVARYFAIDNPQLAICGLNPHAGEQGHLGREEIEIMQPAIKQLRQSGYCVTDPLSADSVFTRDNRARYDAILSPYHDQALTAVKALSFGDGIQMTLGLPFLRLSVDHGTALSLAGTGKASKASLLKAIQSVEKLLTKDNR